MSLRKKTLVACLALYLMSSSVFADSPHLGGMCYVQDGHYFPRIDEAVGTATSTMHQESWEDCYAQALSQARFVWKDLEAPYIDEVALSTVEGSPYNGKAIQFKEWTFEPNPQGWGRSPKGEVTKYSSDTPMKGNQKRDPDGEELDF